MLLNRETELVPPDRLTPHPKNARRGDVDAIAESIRRNGFYGSVIVQRTTGHVLVGNHRLRAAIAAGLDEVPVTYVDVDDETALRILLADNRSSDLATYETGELAALLEQLSTTPDELAGTLYTPESLGELLATLEGATGPEERPAYTQKVEIPVYTPTGPAAPPEELRDRTRADELRREIEATPDLPPDLRAFLLDAAERHVAFRYDRIANYYAHAVPNVQRLFESSALVIIDYDRAIELGFVRLHTEILDSFAEDYPDAL
jgi:ParB/RepB/Spo0J family partition protein